MDDRVLVGLLTEPGVDASGVDASAVGGLGGLLVGSGTGVDDVPLQLPSVSPRTTMASNRVESAASVPQHEVTLSVSSHRRFRGSLGVLGRDHVFEPDAFGQLPKAHGRRGHVLVRPVLVPLVLVHRARCLSDDAHLIDSVRRTMPRSNSDHQRRSLLSGGSLPARDRQLCEPCTGIRPAQGPARFRRGGAHIPGPIGWQRRTRQPVGETGRLVVALSFVAQMPGQLRALFTTGGAEPMPAAMAAS
jgi:hypothetical protein